MKKLVLLLLICFQSQAQLKFWNTNPTSNMPLFEVEWGKKTTIHTKVGKETKPMYVLTKQPFKPSTAMPEQNIK